MGDAVNLISVRGNYDVWRAGLLVLGHPSGGRYCVARAVLRGICSCVFQIAAAGPQRAIWGFRLYETTAQPGASHGLPKVLQRSAVAVLSSYMSLEAPRIAEAARRPQKMPAKALARAQKLQTTANSRLWQNSACFGGLAQVERPACTLAPSSRRRRLVCASLYRWGATENATLAFRA